MAGLLVAKTDLFGQSHSSVPSSIDGVGETSKRRSAADDTGSLPTSSPYSKNTKRHQFFSFCWESNVESSHQFFNFCGKSNVKSSREDISGDEGNREKSSRLRLDHTLSYQTALDTNTVTHGSKPSASPTSNKPYSRSSSVSIDKAALFETSKESQIARKDTVHVSNRKRHFIYTLDDCIKPKMEKYVDDVYKLFDGLGSEGNCWLHPFPPSASKNGRPRGTIQCNFVWNDTSGKDSLYVNVGIVALIIEYHLTKEQMEG